ncbi:hypothetical protein QE152_g24608 [Popillia japonica]|uniref:Uncharacterized protein n=1 Tax=Popillia japonica TaxID=7064 RepID=A0AAW1K5H3_POPJA
MWLRRTKQEIRILYKNDRKGLVKEEERKTKIEKDLREMEEKNGGRGYKLEDYCKLCIRITSTISLKRGRVPCWRRKGTSLKTTASYA